MRKVLKGQPGKRYFLKLLGWGPFLPRLYRGWMLQLFSIFNYSVASLVLSQILEDKITWRLSFLATSYPVLRSSVRPRDSFPAISLSLKNYSFSAKELLEPSSRCDIELSLAPFRAPSLFHLCKGRDLYFEGREESEYNYLRQ